MFSKFNLGMLSPESSLPTDAKESDIASSCDGSTPETPRASGGASDISTALPSGVGDLDSLVCGACEETTCWRDSQAYGRNPLNRRCNACVASYRCMMNKVVKEKAASAAAGAAATFILYCCFYGGIVRSSSRRSSSSNCDDRYFLSSAFKGTSTIFKEMERMMTDCTADCRLCGLQSHWRSQLLVK